MLKTVLLLILGLVNTQAQDNTCEIGSEKFVRLSQVSKYFQYNSINQAPFTFNYHEAKQECESAGLTIAEVMNEVELKSLSAFIQSPQKWYWIGMTDEQEEGQFVETDGMPIQYQAFGLGPVGGTDENCVQLVRSDSGPLQMEDVSCSSEGGILCQFPRGSYCHINSYQANIEIKYGLERLSPTSKFHVSLTQATRDQALIECIYKKTFLLTYITPEMIREMKEELRTHKAFLEADPETTYWTAGEAISNNKILWMTTESIYDVEEDPDKLDLIIEALDPFGPCLDISLDNARQYSSFGKSVLQVSNCNLPKYYICMDMNITIPKETFEERLQKLRDLEETNSLQKNLPSSDKKNPTDPCAAEKTAIIKVPPPKITFKRPEGFDEVLLLRKYIATNKLYQSNVKIDLGNPWKRNIIEQLIRMYQKGVSSVYVPREFLHIVQEINIVYQNIAPGGKDSIDAKGWKEITATLDKCEIDLEEIKLISKGHSVVYWNESVDDHRIFVPTEVADENPDLDIYLDSLWYIFSFTMAACYNHPSVIPRNQITWASKYYVLFVKDFMEKMEKDRWVTDIPQMHQAIMFGDMDVDNILESLRAATSAMYSISMIPDRQVARPIYLKTLLGPLHSSDTQMNYKINEYILN